MDHKQVMVWHLRWTNDLENALREGRPIDLDAVGRDDLCDVGQWLYGDGAQFSALPEYEQFQTLHAQFHAAAKDAAKHAMSGSDPEAFHAFDIGGACDSQSLDLAQKSYALFHAIHKAKEDKN